MKKHISKAVTLAVLTAILLSAGCETNPPVASQDPVLNYGKIFVTSNIPESEIYIDGQNTGRVTPDTVEAVTGTRAVKVLKDGYVTYSSNVEVIKELTVSVEADLKLAKLVLLEDFANVSCVPCVTTNKITHALSQYYGSKLHIIKFPTNFPKPTDLFYLAAKSDCDARMAYYNIITAPTVIIDGVTRPVSSDSNDIKNAIDNAFQEERKFDIIVTDTVFGGSIYTKASIVPLNTAGLNPADYIIHTAIVEKKIDTGTPPGSNGETVFYDVLRKMLPSSAGSDMPGTNMTQTVEYENQVAISSAWNLNEIVTIVYIQDKNTKKVIHSASSD